MSGLFSTRIEMGHHKIQGQQWKECLFKEDAFSYFSAFNVIKMTFTLWYVAYLFSILLILDLCISQYNLTFSIHRATYANDLSAFLIYLWFKLSIILVATTKQGNLSLYVLCVLSKRYTFKHIKHGNVSKFQSSRHCYYLKISEKML